MPSEPATARDRGPHIAEADVGRLVAALEVAQEDARRDIVARLAWRPAWAIRSRSGTVAALREMCGWPAKRK